MTGIRLHIHACSPAQIFIDFFGFARNITAVRTTAIDACLIVGALGFTVPAMLWRGVEIGTFIVTNLEIIFAYDLALAFDTRNAIVADMIAAAAVFGVAHDVDAGSPAGHLAFGIAAFAVVDAGTGFTFFTGLAFFLAAAAMVRIVLKIDACRSAAACRAFCAACGTTA